MKSYDGNQALIRSFPSKVGVSLIANRTRAHTTHHPLRTVHHPPHHTPHHTPRGVGRSTSASWRPVRPRRSS